MARPRPQQSSSQRGFTLLEVITVLIISSLLAVVLMQGLSLILNLRTSLGGALNSLDQRVIMRNRVTEPLLGVFADFDDGTNKFKGSPQQISGLTLNPLFGRTGRPTPFSLEIGLSPSDSSMVSVVYRENNSDPVVIANVPGEMPRFKFLGTSGQWSEEWPATNEPLELGAMGAMRRIIQLPRVIALDLNSATEPDIAIAILARPDRVARDLPF